MKIDCAVLTSSILDLTSKISGRFAAVVVAVVPMGTVDKRSHEPPLASQESFVIEEFFERYRQEEQSSEVKRPNRA